jgi:septum formation protein
MLLESLGVPFTVLEPTAAENNNAELRPHELVMINSDAKARSVADQTGDDDLILGADTIVHLEGRILGKPRDIEEARMMLRALSGNRHFVFTGLTLIDRRSGTVLSDFERTGVVFRHLAESDIGMYLDVISPLDRAGAYTVEGVGALLVERFEGCFYNVVGLPLVKLDTMLRTLGVNLFILSQNRLT